MVDPHRLPRTVVPVRYDLRLEPDLTAFTFTGEETITVEVREATAEILLNAVELEMREATAAHAERRVERTYCRSISQKTDRAASRRSTRNA